MRPHRGRRRRRWAVLLLAGLAVVGVPVAALVALAWQDVAAARAEANRAAALVGSQSAATLESEAGRRHLLEQLDQSERALGMARRRLLRSRALSFAGAFPGGRAVRSALVAFATDAERATAAARGFLVEADASLDGAQVRDGQLPSAALDHVRASAENARDALIPRARGREGWPLAGLRRRFDGEVTALASQLGRPADGLRTASTFFGAAGDRRHLLAFGNNAEMRDGGMVLSYGVLEARGGRFTLAATGSVADLTLSAPAPAQLPPGAAAVFGPLHPTQTWQSVNATADFALSGRLMAAMYHQATGVAVDAVVGVDVPGLAMLLAVVGPVTVAGVAGPVTAENAARVLLHDQYAGIPPLVDVSSRRDRLADLARAVFDRLRAGAYEPIRLGRTLAAAGAARHLQLWSGRADEERFFEGAGLGGGPALVAPERTFHVAVQNRTATKLDYFVHPSVSQQIRLTHGGDAVVTTTVRIENRAPAGAAPSYQLGPDGFTTAPGDYVGSVYVWSPPRGGGDDGPAAIESGLLLAERVVLVKPGEAVDVTFPPATIKGAVRGGRLAIRLVPQARLEPMALKVAVAGRKWQVEGPRQFDGTWNRTHSLSWKVER